MWTRGERGGDIEYGVPLRNLLFPFGTGGDDDQLSEIELPPPGCIVDGIAAWDCREKRIRVRVIVSITCCRTREVVLPFHVSIEGNVQS